MSTKMLRWKSDEEVATSEVALSSNGGGNSELSTIWLTVPQLRARLGLPTDDSTRRQISRWADDLDDCDRRGIGRERKIRLSAMCERLQRTKFGDAVVSIEDECVTLVKPAAVAAPAYRAIIATPTPVMEHSPRYETNVPPNWKAAKPVVCELSNQETLIRDSALNQYEADVAARLILNSGIDDARGGETDDSAIKKDEFAALSPIADQTVIRNAHRYVAGASPASQIVERHAMDAESGAARNPVQLCQERKPLSSMSEREFAEYCRYLQVKTGRVNEASLPKMPEAENEKVPHSAESPAPAESPIVEHRAFRGVVYRSVSPPRSDSSILNRVSKSVGKWFDRKLKPVPASPVYGAFALTARPNRLAKG